MGTGFGTGGAVKPSFAIAGDVREDLAEVLAANAAVSRALVYPITVDSTALFAAYLQVAALPGNASDSDLASHALWLGHELLPSVSGLVPQARFLWHCGTSWPFLGAAGDLQVFLRMFEMPPQQRVLQPEVLSQASNGGTHVFHCRVPEDLVYLQGHFEQEAVVAGVCQLKWLSEWIARITGEPLKLKRMEAVKFHRLLFPGDVFQVEFRFDSKKQKWLFKFFTEAYKVSSGRLCIG